MLKVQHLTKRFGKLEAVKGISFQVNKGEAYGLLGPNGAGKSTTIKMISGLLTPDSGEVVVAGFDVRRQAQAAKRVMGVVPQEIALYPTLSARENLRFWGSLYGLAGKELNKRIDEALEIVSLTDRQKERIKNYSGGMKRRINIAASLLHRPKLLIMDEPAVGIDPQSRNSILETVRRLVSEGMTVIYTSHYMEEVEALCERLAIVDHGQVIAEGELSEVRRLAGETTTIRLRVGSPDETLVATLTQVAEVEAASLEGDGTLNLITRTPNCLPDLIAAVVDAGHHVTGVKVEEPNLEAVFLHLTGRALRD